MNNSSLIDFHARRFPWSLDRLFPIVIVISIFGYEYSTFIWLTFLRLLYNVKQNLFLNRPHQIFWQYPLTGLLVGLELHFFMVLMVASYYKCISVSPGTIPLDIVDFSKKLFLLLMTLFSYNRTRISAILKVSEIMQKSSLCIKSCRTNLSARKQFCRIWDSRRMMTWKSSLEITLSNSNSFIGFS